MPTFEYIHVITVKVNDRKMGEIHQDKDGWRYYPTGAKHGGEAFETIALCKQSIEAP